MLIIRTGSFALFQRLEVHMGGVGDSSITSPS